MLGVAPSLAVALLRWRNFWVKIAVLRNSRREAGCAQRNARFWARNIFHRGRFFFVAAFFFAVGGNKNLGVCFLMNRWRKINCGTFFAIRRRRKN